MMKIWHSVTVMLMLHSRLVQTLELRWWFSRRTKLVQVTLLNVFSVLSHLLISVGIFQISMMTIILHHDYARWLCIILIWTIPTLINRWSTLCPTHINFLGRSDQSNSLSWSTVLIGRKMVWCWFNTFSIPTCLRFPSAWCQATFNDEPLSIIEL